MAGVGFDRRSAGRDKLLSLLSNMTRKSVSDLLGARTMKRPVDVSPAAVGYWANGRNAPLYSQRKALEEAFEIPVGAWDEDPVSARETMAVAA